MLALLRKKENIFKILLFLYFAYLFLSRALYLNADSPAFWFDVEEKSAAYNARNMVLFGEWSSGGVNYDATVSSPLPGMVSYLSFLLLGVSLFSIRLPYALLSALAIFIFYKVLKKEMNPWMAFLGTVIFGSVHFIFLLNRSALIENLFILLPAAALFMYQDYAKTEKGTSLFLFGLFSALNVSVKYDGAYFLIVSAVSVLMMAFSGRKGFSAGMRTCGLYAAGVALSLSLPVLALYFGSGGGALETIKFQCDVQMGAGRYFPANIKLEYPFFFMAYLPFISLASLTGLFSMLFFHLKKLSKTDVLVLLWLILGSAVAFSFEISYKRLIFLIIPVVYVAVKGGWGLWRYLKESNSLRDRGINRSPDCGERAMTSVWKGVGGCGFIVLISWGVRYVLCEDLVTGYCTIPLPAFLKISMAQAARISALISLVLMVPPVASAVCCFITTRDFRLAVATWKRWFVAAILSFSVIAAALSILTNEIRNRDFLFHPKKLKFESVELSRDLGRTLKAQDAIVGSEMALRLLGFENRCKFIFNHDGGNSRGEDYHELDYKDIMRRQDIRYFCMALPNNFENFKKYLLGMEKIKSVYPAMALLKTYRVEDAALFIFDKYPFRES